MTRSRIPSRQAIDDFLGFRSFAVVGVSRSGKKFGNIVYSAFKQMGKRVYPINRFCNQIDEDRCYPSLMDLPEKVEGVVLVVPPNETEKLVKQAAEIGIGSLWIQQGSESRTALEYCEQYGIDVISGQCILMFAEPVKSLHRFHRWVLDVFHKLPS